jgi:hypothetical protein
VLGECTFAADAVVTWPGGKLAVWQRRPQVFGERMGKGPPVERPMLKMFKHIAAQGGFKVDTIMSQAFVEAGATDDGGAPGVEAEAREEVEAVLRRAGALPATAPDVSSE